MRAALYSQVSTRDKGQEVENQLEALRRFCAAQGWVVVREYQDRKSGGTRVQRELQAMLRDAAERRFDVVVFWSMDRLTREGALATLKYLNRLGRCGVGFRSHTEPYLDSCGVFKDVVTAVLGAMAQQERRRRSERVRAGLERARRRGTRSGKPVGRPRVVVDRERVRRLRSEGWSWGRIARQLGITVAAARRACPRVETGSELCQKPPEGFWQGNVETDETY